MDHHQHTDTSSRVEDNKKGDLYYSRESNIKKLFLSYIAEYYQEGCLDCPLEDFLERKDKTVNIELLGAGSYGVVYKIIKKDVNGVVIDRFVMKMVGLPCLEYDLDYSSELEDQFVNGLSFPVDIETHLMEILYQDIYKKKISHHLPRLFYRFTLPNLIMTRDFYRIFKNQPCKDVDPLLDQHSNRLKNNMRDENIRWFIKFHTMTKPVNRGRIKCFLSEFCDEGDLYYWMRSLGKDKYHTVENFRIMIFQVIFTIFQIQRLYPEFMHRDLSLANILIERDPNYKEDEDGSSEKKGYCYNAEGLLYFIPCIKYRIKIWDFGFSDIIDSTFNKVIAERSESWTTKNHYFDLSVLFNSIRQMSFYLVRSNDQDAKDLLDFLELVVPDEFTSYDSNQRDEEESYRDNLRKRFENKNVPLPENFENNFYLRPCQERMETPVEYVTPRELLHSYNYLTKSFIVTENQLSFYKREKLQSQGMIIDYFADCDSHLIRSEYGVETLNSKNIKLSERKFCVSESKLFLERHYRQCLRDLFSLHRQCIIFEQTIYIERMFLTLVFPKIYTILYTEISSRRNDLSLDLCISKGKSKCLELVEIFKTITKVSLEEEKQSSEIIDITLNLDPIKTKSNLFMTNYYKEREEIERIISSILSSTKTKDIQNISFSLLKQTEDTDNKTTSHSILEKNQHIYSQDIPQNISPVINPNQKDKYLDSLSYLFHQHEDRISSKRKQDSLGQDSSCLAFLSKRHQPNIQPETQNQNDFLLCNEELLI